MRRCDNYGKKVNKYNYIQLDEYIEINKKLLKVFAVFSKESAYYYLAKLYESSNHYFLVSEVKKGTRRKHEVLFSFTGNEEGLEKSIYVMFAISDENKNYRGLKRIN